MGGDRRSPKKATFQAPFGLWPTRLISAAAAAYATLLVIATHTPRPERVLGSGLAASDKLLHVVAYAGLGLLAALLVRARGRLVPRLTPLLAAGLAVWAAVDEATQPLFGRHGDPLDWIADVVGIAAGIAAVVVAVALADAHRAAAGTPARDPSLPGSQ